MRFCHKLYSEQVGRYPFEKKIEYTHNHTNSQLTNIYMILTPTYSIKLLTLDELKNKIINTFK